MKIEIKELVVNAVIDAIKIGIDSQSIDDTQQIKMTVEAPNVKGETKINIKKTD